MALNNVQNFEISDILNDNLVLNKWNKTFAIYKKSEQKNFSDTLDIHN